MSMPCGCIQAVGDALTRNAREGESAPGQPMHQSQYGPFGCMRLKEAEG